MAIEQLIRGPGQQDMDERQVYEQWMQGVIEDLPIQELQPEMLNHKIGWSAHEGGGIPLSEYLVSRRLLPRRKGATIPTITPPLAMGKHELQQTVLCRLDDLEKVSDYNPLALYRDGLTVDQLRGHVIAGTEQGWNEIFIHVFQIELLERGIEAGKVLVNRAKLQKQ
jgi:hypothetical protein